MIGHLVRRKMGGELRLRKSAPFKWGKKDGIVEDACRLYFQEGLSEPEIAVQLGLSEDTIYRLLKKKGVCALCGKTGRLVNDHDHESGLIRQLICYSCNVGLGLFKDSPVLLVKAAKYLLKHKRSWLDEVDLQENLAKTQLDALELEVRLETVRRWPKPT